MNRREFIQTGTMAGTALVPVSASAGAAAPGRGKGGPAKFKLGTVSYNIGAKWDLTTMLDACKATGFEKVELRTTHAHKVEIALGPEERRRVKGQIADSGIKLWSLGSICEFHSSDPAVVKKNIEDCRAFCQLAHDLGAPGVKVRPNALVQGVEPARTLEQIGRAL